MNFFTSLRSAKGGALAKLFQTSTRRLAGHDAAASLSSVSVVNVAPVTPASLMAASLVWVNGQVVVGVDAVSGHVMFPLCDQVRSCAARFITLQPAWIKGIVLHL